MAGSTLNTPSPHDIAQRALGALCSMRMGASWLRRHVRAPVGREGELVDVVGGDLRELNCFAPGC